MLAVCLRARPHIDRDIENLAAQHAHQLGLRMWRFLAVQAAHDIFIDATSTGFPA